MHLPEVTWQDLFLLSPSSSNYECAEYSPVGTWSFVIQSDPPGTCPTCRRGTTRLVPPMVIVNSMDGGNMPLCDCSWSLRTMIVTEDCAHRMQGAGLGIEFDAVVLTTTERHEQGANTSNPFVGVTMKWPKAARSAKLDLAASGIDHRDPCPTCKQVGYGMRLQNLVALGREGDEGSVLQIEEFRDVSHRLLFVSSCGRHLLERANISNISFLPVGKIAFS